jgi:hypothetical protein
VSPAAAAGHAARSKRSFGSAHTDALSRIQAPDAVIRNGEVMEEQIHWPTSRQRAEQLFSRIYSHEALILCLKS